MKIILFSIFITVAGLVVGQNHNDSLKNEIGVNIIPTIKVLNQFSSKNLYDNSIFYKRMLGKKIWFRFCTGIILDKEYDGYSAPLINNYNNLFVSVDYWEKRTRPQYYLTSGAEYRWGKKRVKCFAGLDVGYSQVQQSITNYFGLRDKWYPIEIEHFSFDGFYKNQDSIIYSYRINTRSFMINPFFGIQCWFTNRMAFTIQFGLPFYYSNSEQVDVAGTKPLYWGKPYNGWELKYGRLLNNFSLCYRF